MCGKGDKCDFCRGTFQSWLPNCVEPITIEKAGQFQICGVCRLEELTSQMEQIPDGEFIIYTEDGVRFDSVYAFEKYCHDDSRRREVKRKVQKKFKNVVQYDYDTPKYEITIEYDPVTYVVVKGEDEKNYNHETDFKKQFRIYKNTFSVETQYHNALGYPFGKFVFKKESKFVEKELTRLDQKIESLQNKRAKLEKTK